MKRYLIAFALLIASCLPTFAQTGSVVPPPVFTAFDNSGNIIASGKLCSYLTGSATPVDTYTTAALSTANSNPVVMDSAGRATVFLTPGVVYRFTLLTAGSDATCATGSTIWTVDGITTGPANTTLSFLGTAGEAISAGDVVYLSDGSGALTAGSWYKADADNAYSSSTATSVGMAPSAISSGASGTIQLGGLFTMPAATLTAGTDYYVSATAGGLTSTAPANSRRVGRSATTQTLVLSIQTITPSNLPLGCQGRLTLTTGTAVTTADVTAATTVYYTPYKGDRCSLYDGAQWQTVTFTEKSVALGTDTTDKNYDLFGYLSSSTLAIERLVWTNDTTRATTLTLVNGMWTKTGDSTRLYLGTYRTTGAGQTEDSFAKRFAWNNFNRVPRPMRVVDATDSWNYTTATIRQANGSTANQIAFVIGLAEVQVSGQVFASGTNGTTVALSVGIGEDSTSTYTTGFMGGSIGVYGTGNQQTAVTASLIRYPAVGYHFWAWLERSSAVGTTTWYGDDGAPTLTQSGISGWLEG